MLNRKPANSSPPTACQMPKIQFLKLTTLFSAGLASVTLVLNRWLTGEYFPAPVALTGQAAGLAVVAAIPLMAVILLLVRVDPIFMPGILAKLRQIKPLLIGLKQTERIYIAVLAGFSEELLFRGFLQPLVGIAAASIIFGAMHAVTFGYFLLAGAMGFYLGWLFQSTGNLLVPMAVHALYDVFALNLLAWIYLREERETEDPQAD
jgi:uncharacterized protein